MATARGRTATARCEQGGPVRWWGKGWRRCSLARGGGAAALGTGDSVQGKTRGALGFYRGKEGSRVGARESRMWLW
ncbi:hypothetical protein GUJ93_ZPchr0012g21233 [Zizania palustris]|uniref:Uncharacterized protein n=1 Tax=Zizania palustris TaxID=103762 RepID=A0A8J6BWG0_ZIZPA|nr:hypothetical protein GUJ93_ZPchr0012g21233 [Zizania palustris]